MSHALITGGAGFFGEILKQRLLADGWQVTSIDLEPDSFTHPKFRAIQGDIRDAATLDRVFSEEKFDVIFHLAAILAHAVNDTNHLWTCNVDGTRRIAEAAKKYGVKKIVYTSSNCLWGEPMGRPIREEDAPNPVEIYGRSKLEGEKILASFAPDVETVMFRCTTIIDSGRLGLLAILFEFIDEGRRVWVVGNGENRYQFLYAQDLADACVKAADYNGSAIFHIGSDGTERFRDAYQYVIDRAKTKARVASLPKGFTLFMMRVMYKLGLSPLGPYQYKMIAEDFEFDTTKIKRELGWRSTCTNAEMLWKAYEHYRDHRGEIEKRTNVSAHKQAAKMGIIRVLKWIS